MDYDNLDDLLNDLKYNVENPLLDTLGEVSKEVLKETIDETIYNGEFQPNVYLRRYENGGFGDERNIHMTKIDNGVLQITNDTLANGDESGQRLDEIIEYGQDYHWRNQPPPRPVFEITKAKLNSGLLENVTKIKLKEIGYETD